MSWSIRDKLGWDFRTEALKDSGGFRPTRNCSTPITMAMFSNGIPGNLTTGAATRTVSGSDIKEMDYWTTRTANIRDFTASVK